MKTIEINRPLPEAGQIWTRYDGVKILIGDVSEYHVYFKYLDTGNLVVRNIADFMSFKTVISDKRVRQFAVFVQL